MKNLMDFPPNIQHVLLDIEGTTCPVNFVSDTLFPFANDHLLSYLKHHQTEPTIRSLIAEIQIAWQEDSSTEARALAKSIQQIRTPTAPSRQIELTPEEACLYLKWLIQQDRKLTPLKELQGMIWEEGYQQGQLVAPLFPDVPDALYRWHQAGRILSVYSSGSIQAQKLLYSFSNVGDLSHLFSSWFDTRTGPKNEAASYLSIAKHLQTKPEHIVFISDSPSELSAARSAAVHSIFSRRPGNPILHAEGFPILESFSEI
jgi:enolase-phosphatase E1